MKKTQRLLLMIAFGLSVLQVSNADSHAFNQQDTHLSLSIVDPWVRSAPANAPALGVFMTIRNHTNQPVRLMNASVDSGYDRVELHRTQQVNNMMKMLKQDFIPIPAQGSLTLKPGSWHVMLIGPSTVPGEGELVSMQLNFDNNVTKMITAKVKKGKMMHHKPGH